MLELPFNRIRLSEHAEFDAPSAESQPTFYLLPFASWRYE